MKSTKTYSSRGECYEWKNSQGKYHREDGPAIEYDDGGKCWYYHGERIFCETQQEFEKLIKLQSFR